jgi:diaminohydroxyphosphoribosylaminopyrimidine deaminase/5-amino-6-(5-phosphoribosylamino)uracil reductase
MRHGQAQSDEAQPAQVDPRSGSSRERDLRFMREALAAAMRIPTRPWPNPPVGAVVVRDETIVGRGGHVGAGAPHAERVALAEAGDAARGATLYCTLEPCDHHGRTPPCTEAILAAGIARVVYAVADPNPIAAGGAARLRGEGLAVEGGVLADACLDLVWPYVCTDQFRRPYVELKTAVSLDGRFGRIGSPPGAPFYLTGESARRDVHRRRRWVDLVLVGHGTARQDRPRLDTRLATDPDQGPTAPPAAGVVARDGGADAPLNAGHWLVFHDAAARPALSKDAEGVPCRVGADGALDPVDLVARCGERGLHTLMIEGGPRLAASFLAADLVDRWVLYLAPRTIGAGPTWPEWPASTPSGWSLTRSDRVGEDLRTVWDRRDYADQLGRLGHGEAG